MGAHNARHSDARVTLQRLHQAKRFCTCMGRRRRRCQAHCPAYRRAATHCHHAQHTDTRLRADMALCSQVGAPLPAEMRLKFAAELFNVVDVDGDRELDPQQLQVRAWQAATATLNTQRADGRARRTGCAARACVAAPPERRDAALWDEGRRSAARGTDAPARACAAQLAVVPSPGLVLTSHAPHVCARQDFVMFVSAVAKTHQLLALIPVDLLHEVRSLYGLVSRHRGVLDRQVRDARKQLRHLASSLGHSPCTCVHAGAGDAHCVPRPRLE